MTKTVTYTKGSKSNSSKVLINGSPRRRFPTRSRRDHAVYNKIEQRKNFVPGTSNSKVTVIIIPDK